MKKENKFYIYLYSFLVRVSLYTPIFGAFLAKYHNFSNSQIIQLFGIFSITTFIFEIPSGIISDYIGEKNSLLITSSLMSVSTILFIYGNTYLIFLAEVFLAVSSAFMSGSFESLIYKYYKNKEMQNNIDKFIARVYSFQWGALCFSFFCSTVFLKFMNLHHLFLITLLFNFLSFIIAFKLPNVSNSNIDCKESSSKIHFNDLEIIFASREVKFSFFYNAVTTSILVTGYQMLQPYLNNLEISSNVNGLFYFFGALVASMGSEIFAKLSSRISYKTIFSICVLFLCISFFGLFISTKNVLLIGLMFCLYRLSWGISTPLLVLFTNKSLKQDSLRNTFFSIISLSSNLFTSLILFVFGKFDMEIGFNYFILGVLLIFLSLIILFNWPSNIDNKSKIHQLQ